jgi:hypothetical protein
MTCRAQLVQHEGLTCAADINIQRERIHQIRGAARVRPL